ncbi:MAG: hypothetical protein NG747_11645 [Candidatus Brocadia sp.]|nr:hypothetical protein [Candidatus Brocadia sp.]
MSFRKKTNINKFQFWFSAEMLAVPVGDMAQTALELIRKPCISPPGHNSQWLKSWYYETQSARRAESL